MKRVALIPYFGGTSTATHSRTDTRRSYLDQTIGSLDGFDVIVGVCRQEDVDGVLVEAKPEWLPAVFFKWAQENVDADLVYVTEADHILTLDPTLLAVPDDQNYLVPHRLNEIGPEGQGRGTHQEIFLNGVEYQAPNGLPEGEDEFYRPSSLVPCFGGAFLATLALFRRINFRLNDGSPVECATGFDVYQVGECLKTTAVERFWVEHLSSREHHGIT
jgi:hypothetical protein